MTPTLWTSRVRRPRRHRHRRRPLRSALGWGTVLVVVFAGCGAFLWYTRPRPLHAGTPEISFETAVAEMRQVNEIEPPKPRGAAPISEDDKLRAYGRLGRIDRLLRDFARNNGGFPIGTNAEITRALRGENARHIIFVTPDEMPMNDRGELIDDWQTPYFFHQVSGSQMEIYSAGPDKQMWTADDLTMIAR
jgi:hypothetical protein